MRGQPEDIWRQGGHLDSELTSPPERVPKRGRRDNAVYLSAPINAILEGLYEEKTTIGDIRKRGDFGLGTFNHLDGELVLLDGQAYQVRIDGKADTVGDGEHTPFACVTFFQADTWDEFQFPDGSEDKGIFDLLEMLIPSPNMLYAIRVEGFFESVKTRSVPRTDNYLPLVEATKRQMILELSAVEGSMAGFFTPGFMASLSAPGYHLHLLTHDRRYGGHLLDCRLRSGRIGIQHIPRLEVDLPFTLDYLTTQFNRDPKSDLDKAER